MAARPKKRTQGHCDVNNTFLLQYYIKIFPNTNNTL